jgi:hypothetical protein
MCDNGYFKGDWKSRTRNRNCFLHRSYTNPPPDCVVESKLIGPADTSSDPLLVSKTTDEKDDSIAQKRIVNTAIFCSGAGTE